MKLIDLLNLGGTHAGDALKTQLQNEELALPDLKPAIDPILAALDTDISAAQIVDLVTVIGPEIKNILTGHLDPKPHAGDAT